MVKLLDTDLRSFGLIGFQKPWLDYHKTEKGEIARKILYACQKLMVNCCAITSEDSQMFRGLPEDRFGFIKENFQPISEPIKIVQAFSDQMAMGFDLTEESTTNRIVLVNSETVSASKGQNWYGIKVHAVGGNCLPKNLSLRETLRACKERGLISFLMNVGVSENSLNEAEEMHKLADGIIVYDANNCFPNWFRHVPLVKDKLGKYLERVNVKAEGLATRLKVPGIAVSSSHFMHQIGTAGIETGIDYNYIFGGSQLLNTLRDNITKRHYELIRYPNSRWDVAKFAWALFRRGRDTKRFKDCESSYNEKD